MKFKTSVLSRLNVFRQSYITFDDYKLTIVTKGLKFVTHVNDISYVDIATPTIGFSTLELFTRIPKRKISIYGFTERQCEEINATINTNQIDYFEFYPSRQDANLRVMQSFASMLIGLSSPRKFERPLVLAILFRLEEGLRIARKLRDIEWNMDLHPEVELEK